MGFGVNADDGLGVRLAEMHPTVLEVNLDAVDISDFLVFEALFDGFKQSIDVERGRKFDFGLIDGIIGIFATEFADLKL